MIIGSALIIWKSLMLVTGSESPVRHRQRRTANDAAASTTTSQAWHRSWTLRTRRLRSTLEPWRRCRVRRRTRLRPSAPVARVQVVVVLSGSMEPGMYRGDILFLNLGKAPIRTGEIVVFNIDGRDIPIVHRVIKVGTRSCARQLACVLGV